MGFKEMKRYLTKIVITALVLIISTANSFSQCAMCRASVETNANNGDTGFAASLNFGILYLFVAPYLLIALIGFLWYRQSKKNAKKVKFKSFKRA